MAAKKHIVKINEEQYSYFKGEDDTQHFDGNRNVSVNGKLNRDEDGNPDYTDKVGAAFTPQAWTYYKTNRLGRISEAEHMGDEDVDNDKVDDAYNVQQANVMSNGNPSDNLTVVPQSVIMRTNALLQTMKNLSPIQTANVVNKFLESIDFSTMPYKLKKEIRLKVN